MKKTLAPSQSITTRDSKGQKFISVVEAAYNKAGLFEEEAQRMNDAPGLSDLIHNFIAKNRLTDKFKDEEVKSSYGYLSGYKKPKGITEQTNILRQLFPGIGFANEELAQRPLPENSEVEGYFAIPRWESVAKTYGEAVQKVLDLINQTRNGKFCNRREGQLGPRYLQQSEKAVKTFQKLGEEQKGYDILVVPAQFGIIHRGRSVRRAREVMRTSQFGLGAFAIGIMLLTHQERLQHYDDLWIDCAGDEFAPDADGDFRRAPYFRFSDSRVKFDSSFVGNPLESYGSASGFFPQ